MKNSKHRSEIYGRFAATEWYAAGLDRLQVIPEGFSYEIIDDQCVEINVKSVHVLGTGRGAF